MRIGDGSLDLVDSSGGPDAVLAAPANDLLLALWGRIGLDRLDRSGDPTPLERLLAGADFD